MDEREPSMKQDSQLPKRKSRPYLSFENMAEENGWVRVVRKNGTTRGGF